MRVGVTRYLNALPFYYAFQKGALHIDVEWILETPTTLNRLLKERELDCALISSYAYLEQDYHPLTPFGIGSFGPIFSVNLYIQEAHENDSPLLCAVTEESATSVQLLKVLARSFWKREIVIKPLDRHKPLEENKALLLIGDEALHRQTLTGFRRIDLAEAWQEATGRGFLFALFATHKERASQLTNFCQKLAESLHWGLSHLNEIVAVAHKKSQLPLPLLRSYYKAHSYLLTQRESEGLTHFAHLLQNV